MNGKPKLFAIFFRTEAGREPVREWLQGLDKSDKQRIGVDIEKVRFLWPCGSNFDDFLKEEGIFEEVTALAQKELEVLRDANPLESDDTSEPPSNLRSRIGRFFRRVRHAMNL